MFAWSSVSQLKKYISNFQTSLGLCFRGLMLRVIGPGLLILANCLLIMVKLGFIFIFLPDLSNGSTLMYFFHLAIGTFLFVNVMFNYWLCAFSSPGYPPTCAELFTTTDSFRIIDGKKVMTVPSRIEISPAVSYRYCRHCDCIKPPRAHHDSISGKCVLHMDHFCPWMSNCVGYNNYRYFVLFLFYLFIGCLYVIYITFRSMSISHINNLVISGYDKDSLTVLLCTVAFAVSISVGILLIIHIYLCITNQTTIELYINFEEASDAKRAGKIYKNPFDKGFRKNMRRVFGDNVTWYEAISLSLRSPSEPEYPLSVTDYMKQEKQYNSRNNNTTLV